ncbi:unnamed protein product [Paramecium primaurelia]|uniref:Uncharacterized protein n=1 Tax=Paramecium primaurelia TaxID=5886 RepID=A0A8S1LQ06_PARPR|nr:unnamed protein product [Paramecium primaurelia]
MPNHFNLNNANSKQSNYFSLMYDILQLLHFSRRIPNLQLIPLIIQQLYPSNLLSQPKQLQKLKIHQGCIFCLLICRNCENIILSGNLDFTFKFWSQHSKRSCQQTINSETA